MNQIKHKEISLNKRQQIHKTYLIDYNKKLEKKIHTYMIVGRKWKPK